MVRFGVAEAWVPPSDISDIFFKYKCNVTDCAKALNISRETLYKHFKENTQLKAKFDNVQTELQNEWLDQAEKVVWYSLALAKDSPQHALKAATYILDRKGKERGWVAPLQSPIEATTINYNLNYSNDDDDPVKILSENLSASDTSSAEQGI